MKKLEDPLMNLEKVSEYKCDKCRDITYIVEDGEARECECKALRDCEDILRRSGISEAFRKKRFDNFDFSRDKATMDGYKIATGYALNFKDKEKDRDNSIMFIGQVGSGKTHLSLAIANELMDSGVGVLYMGYREVVTGIKQNIMDEVYYNRVMGRYKSCRVLLIDDLFKGGISKSDVNIVFEILNFRYLNGLPVIVSSELGVSELMAVDEAIGSRLMEMCGSCLVEMKGKRLNYRIYG